MRNTCYQNKELSNCVFVKTILSLMVVLYHSIVFWGGDWFTRNPVYESKILEEISKWLNTIHIYGFALVSGYIYYYIRCEKNGYFSYIEFLKSKVKRLLVPYFFVAILWVVPIQCLFIEYEVEELILRFGLATAPNQLWFLIMLFDVFVVFWPLSTFILRHDILGGILACVVYGLGLVGSSVFINIFSIWTACSYFLFFGMGFKIRQHGSDVLRKIPTAIYVFVDILLFAFVELLSQYDGLLIKLLKAGCNFLLRVVGAVFVFVVLQKVADSIQWEKSKVFSILSKNSMPIYLFHQQIIYFFIWWCNGKVNPYLNALLCFIGAIALALLLSVLLKKFKVTRFLIGEK